MLVIFYNNLFDQPNKPLINYLFFKYTQFVINKKGEKMKKLLAIALLSGFALHAASVTSSRSSEASSAAYDKSPQQKLERIAQELKKLPENAIKYGDERLQAVADLFQEFSSNIILAKASAKDQSQDDQTKLNNYLNRFESAQGIVKEADLAELKKIAQQIVETAFGASEIKNLKTQIQSISNTDEFFKLLKTISTSIKQNFEKLNLEHKEVLLDGLALVLKEFTLPKYAEFKRHLALADRLQLLADEIRLASKDFTEEDIDAIEKLEEFFFQLLTLKDLETFKTEKAIVEELIQLTQNQNVDQKSLIKALEHMRDEIIKTVIVKISNSEVKEHLSTELKRSFEDRSPFRQIIILLGSISNALRLSNLDDSNSNALLKRLFVQFTTAIENKLQAQPTN